MKKVAIHNHSTYSNFRVIDAITRTDELILTADKLGYSALALTDHETIAGSVQILKDLKRLKQEGKLNTFEKIILGNEIYLVDSLEEVKDNYESGVTKFPHFLLMAKNRKGFELLCRQSSHAWGNAFYTGFLERTPTTKGFLREMIQSEEYKGTILATSACVGSNINIPLGKAMEMEPHNLHLRDKYIKKARKEVEWCIETFGKEDFYLELQPAQSPIQLYCNEWLVKFSHEYGLKTILANDTHFARPEDYPIHKAFLQSKSNSDRELDEFYIACYMHSEEEMKNALVKHIGQEEYDRALKNTCDVFDKVESYELDHTPIIPKPTIPKFELSNVFAPAYDKYKSLKHLSTSEHEEDRYLLYLLEEGYFRDLHYDGISKEEFHKILNRINSEVEQVIGVGQKINQAMSGYYLTCREIVNIMWQDDECGGQSIVGSGRGSGAGFLINYLLGITQINPLDYYNMPYKRHLSKERVNINNPAGSLPDIDIDCEGSQRKQIINALKKHYGTDKVLQVSTYGTEGAKSAIKLACRSLGIDDKEAQYLGSFIQTVRGKQHTINQTMYGDEEKDIKPNTQFKNEMLKHEGLYELASRVEGLITKRGIHAGGVIIYNEPYYKNNAMMTASKGEAHVSQFNLSDSEVLGGTKFDVLSVENLDRIKGTLLLLEKDGYIDSNKTLRENFNEILHPKNLNLEDKEYFKMASTGEVGNLFQFSTEIGNLAALKVKPQSFEELCAANSLMRLQSENGEQPIDKYIRHKENINEWYQEMNEWGLNEKEVKVLEKHLAHDYGLNITQEMSMALAGDPNISNFDELEQNKLRKVIAKPKGAALEEVKMLFYKKGKEQGTRKEMLDYVWEVQFKLQFSYSFSQLHVTAYSIIGIQNLELNRRFPPIYWQTACLNVDADTLSTDSKDIDYEKIANGIGKMISQGTKVLPPSINKSRLEFTPDKENNTIIYGLKPVKSLNNEIVEHIINNRPYSSLKDVLTKLYDTKLIKTTHLINIVKSGMLDEFGERKQIMMDVIRYITDTKTNLTMQNIKLLLEADILSDRSELELILFKESFKNKVLRKDKSLKTKNKVFKVEDMETYDRLVGDNGVLSVTPNYYEVSEKEFDKFFQKEISDLKEWLKTEEPINRANKYALNEAWKKHAGSMSYAKWEMETLSYYYHEHELAHVNTEMYDISSFSDLPEEPVVIGESKFNGRTFPKYALTHIAGTVIAKNATKHLVTILTHDGSVVSVKYQGNFSYYDKTTKINGSVVENSWFAKGNYLLVYGFRRGGQFVAKKYADSPTATTTKLIEDISDDGLLAYRIEREY